MRLPSSMKNEMTPPSLPWDLPVRTASDKGFDKPEESEATVETEHKAEGNENEEYRKEQDLAAEVDLVGPRTKKKKSKKPRSKRGMNKPTGFEKYYVDAPMTPEEYEEERSLYDVSRPIIHRMEDAILRFHKKRRIESNRSDIFMKYLSYGGVDVSPKMFGGIDSREMEEMDSEQTLIARGQTTISQNRSELGIDFDTVVRGYLTSFFPYYFNPDTKEMIQLATVTIRNFLSYLLYHDVCPEHKENMDKARKSCDIATEELWKNHQFTAAGLGNFNTACSTLFGGYFFDTYIENGTWTNPRDDTIRMTNDIARKVVKFALAGAGTNEQATRFRELANQNALTAMQVEDINGFEVTAIFPPDEGMKEFYHVHAPDLEPVGRILGKAYRDPGKPRIDLTPEEEQERERKNGKPASLPVFEFFVEESRLNHCYPGMKIITSVWELNCGMQYFDDVITAYCSIYTVLANDLMLGWKEPRSIVQGEEDNEEGNHDQLEETAKGVVAKELGSPHTRNTDLIHPCL